MPTLDPFYVPTRTSRPTRDIEGKSSYNGDPSPTPLDLANAFIQGGWTQTQLLYASGAGYVIYDNFGASGEEYPDHLKTRKCPSQMGGYFWYDVYSQCINAGGGTQPISFYDPGTTKMTDCGGGEACVVPAKPTGAETFADMRANCVPPGYSWQLFDYNQWEGGAYGDWWDSGAQPSSNHYWQSLVGGIHGNGTVLPGDLRGTYSNGLQLWGGGYELMSPVSARGVQWKVRIQEMQRRKIRIQVWLASENVSAAKSYQLLTGDAACGGTINSMFDVYANTEQVLIVGRNDTKPEGYNGALAFFVGSLWVATGEANPLDIAPGMVCGSKYEFHDSGSSVMKNGWWQTYTHITRYGGSLQYVPEGITFPVWNLQGPAPLRNWKEEALTYPCLVAFPNPGTNYGWEIVGRTFNMIMMQTAEYARKESMMLFDGATYTCFAVQPNYYDRVAIHSLWVK